MFKNVKAQLQKELSEIKDSGLFKSERIIQTPQGAAITTESGGEVLNFCANNYLGLSSNSKVIRAAKKAITERGYGLSSVRFIDCSCLPSSINLVFTERRISGTFQPLYSAGRV